MFKKTLTGCLTAAAIAAGGVLPAATPASATGLSLEFFFGSSPFVLHHHHHRGPELVCRTKFKVVWRHHKKHRVAIGKSCNWVMARPHAHFAPMPYHMAPNPY